ncbi:MAG: glycosyltransferase [Clostridia bacterium]
MRIFIISRGYPSNKYIMNGIFEYDQAKALSARGHKVVLIVIDLRSLRRWRKWGRESLFKDNVHIEAINIPLGRVPKRLLSIFGTLGVNIVYKVCVKKFGKPDIVHAHFFKIAHYASRGIRNRDVPLIMTEHSADINKDNIKHSDRVIAQFTYDNVDEIIAVSPSLQIRLQKTFNKRSFYIPNIVNLDIFKYKPRTIDDNIFRIVSVGNLISLKRMDKLIAGFKRFHEHVSNSELVIFGAGSEFNKLKDQIIQLSLEESVFLKGMTQRLSIAKTLADASCFILVSSSETFGVAYIEALACGVPVIATRCGGPEEFIHPGNGILVPVDDDSALYNAMKELYSNIYTYDRMLIAEEIVKKFSPEAVAESLEQKYIEILRGENDNKCPRINQKHDSIGLS